MITDSFRLPEEQPDFFPTGLLHGRRLFFQGNPKNIFVFV